MAGAFTLINYFAGYSVFEPYYNGISSLIGQPHSDYLVVLLSVGLIAPKEWWPALSPPNGRQWCTSARLVLLHL